jgi:DNA-binding FadR family transcriptional regulator
MTSSFERIQVSPAYKIVFEAIERRIVDGRLRVGDRLPTETEMAEDFGVNRSTVREGIRLLEQSGLVRREEGRRLFVAPPRYEDLASRLTRAMILHQVSFRELWVTSMILEPGSAALAAEEISDEELDALGDNVERTAAAVARGDSIIDLDKEFHVLIAQAGKSRVLMLAREPGSLLFAPPLLQIMIRNEQAPHRLLQAHRYIYEALRAHDRDTAELWMRKHIVDFRRGYEMAGLDLDEPVDAIAFQARANPEPS